MNTSDTVRYRIFVPETESENLPATIIVEAQYPTFSVVTGPEEVMADLCQRYPVEELSGSAWDGAQDPTILAARLSHENPDVRLSAAYELGQIGPEAAEAVPALIQAAEDLPVDVRVMVTYALGRIGLPAAIVVPALVKLLEDDHENVRYSAARALGNLGPTALDATAPLLEMLQSDDDGDVRYAAIEAFGQIDPTQEAIPVLVEALQDPNWYVREGVATILTKLGEEAATALVAEIKQSKYWSRRNTGIDVLARMPDEAIPQLHAVLNDSGTSETYKTLSLVSLILMARDTFDVVEEAMQSNSLAVISASALFGEAAVPMLVEALADDDQNTRQQAVTDALATIGPAVAPRMVDIVKGDDVTRHSGAICVLHKLNVAGVPHLLQLFDEVEDANVQQEIIKALGEITAPSAEVVTTLVQVAENKQASPDLRATALHSLGQHGAATLTATPTGTLRILSVLEAALQADDVQIIASAAEALGTIGLPAQSAESALLAVLNKQNDPEVRRHAVMALVFSGSQARATVAMVADFVNAYPYMAFEAAQDLARIGSAAAPALIQTYEDGEGMGRFVALMVLSHMDGAAAPFAVALLKRSDVADREPIVKALWEIGPAWVPYLCAAFLAESDKEIRQRIVDLFVNIGPQAITGIMLARQDPEIELSDEQLAQIFEEYDAETPGEQEVIVTKGLAVAQAIPFLLSMLSPDQEVAVRQEAALALGMIGPEAAVAVPLLAEALRQQSSAALACTAAVALLHIGPAAVTAAPTIAHALSNAQDDSLCEFDRDHRRLMRARPHAVLAEPVIAYSMEHGDKVELPRLLINLLTVMGPIPLGAAPDVLSPLMKLLHREALCRFAAEALGHMGPVAVPALLQVLVGEQVSGSPLLEEALCGKGNALRRSAAYALLINEATGDFPTTEIASIVDNEAEDRFLRVMCATILTKNGHDLTEFWSNIGINCPLDATSPQWLNMDVAVTGKFDIYYDECVYREKTQAPPWRKIYKALVNILRHL